MNINNKDNIGMTFAFIVSLASLSGFLFLTKMMLNPLILFGISIFLLSIFRKESIFVKRIILLILLIFTGWMLSDMSSALMPFALSFLIGYLLDPFVSYLQNKGIPRWLTSLSIILLVIGIISIIGVFVFPPAFSQLEDAIPSISGLVSSLSTYLDSNDFYSFLNKFGLPKETIRPLVQGELIPRLESAFTVVLQALLSLLTSVSTLATQLVNAIITPILSFYFLKDFNQIKEFVDSLLKKKNAKLLDYIHRISIILRKYIGWQIIAASLIGTICSIAFSIFGIPYPVVLGVLCGLLNPIPTVGIIASMVICIIAVILINPIGVFTKIITIAIIILVVHFINAYLIEPKVLGKQVGLHPILLLASLFIFGGLFGFIGLLIAVPSTAILMMFFNDWSAKIIAENNAEIIQS